MVEKTVEEIQEIIKTSIDEHGYFMQGVNGVVDDETTGYCYTIGLTAQMRPDIYFNGPLKILGHKVLTHVAELITKNKIQVGKIYSMESLECQETGEPTRFIIRYVPLEEKKKLPGIFNRYSKMEVMPYPVEVVLADKYNNIIPSH